MKPKLWHTNSEPANIYEKTKLEDATRDIRILTLLPGEEDKPIVCELATERLVGGSQFDALSYAWGQAGDANHKITIRLVGQKTNNDTPVAVLPNLFNALKNLRLTSQRRRLWVDAICINQMLKTERELQVGIMRSIYAAARQTIVWLGKEDANSTEVFKACNEMRKTSTPEDVAIDFTKAWESRKDVKDGLGDMDLLRDRIFSKTYWTKQSVKGTKFEDLQYGIIPALVNMLERGWFSRLWVLQEAAVSKDVLVQCGKDEIPLSPLIYYATLLGTVAGHGLTFKQGAHGVADNRWYERIMSFMTLIAAEDSRVSGTRTFSLPTVLSNFRRFDCQEPSDKLFALYGLAANDVKKLGLEPNYRVSPEKLYTDVTLAILRDLKDFSILEIPRGDEKLRLRLPTWVCDWTDASRFGVGLTPETQSDRVPLEQHSELAKARLAELDAADLARIESTLSDGGRTDAFLHTFRTNIKDVEPVQMFEASGKSKPCDVQSNGGILSVRAMISDHVEQASEVSMALEGPPDPGNLHDEEFAAHWTRTFATLSHIVEWQRELVGKKHRWTTKFRKAAELYPTGESLDMALVQTMCAGSRPGHYSFANQWTTNEGLCKAVEQCELRNLQSIETVQ